MAGNTLYKFRRAALVIAEFLDYWSIVPRAMVVAYGIMLYYVFLWYKSIPTYPLYKCDPATLQVFISAHMALDQAKAIACSIADTVGGPTASQTTFVGAVFGLAPIIFGLYTSTGPKWNAVNYNQLQPLNVTPPIVTSPNNSETPVPTPAEDTE
jgi:hypothetical protein